MKIKNVVTVLLVAIILASCAPAATVVPTKTVIASPAYTPIPQLPTATPETIIVTDLRNFIIDSQTSWTGNILTLNNSENDNWYGATIGYFPIQNPFRLKVQFSFAGEYAAIPIYGSTESLDRLAMILEPNGRFMFEDGKTGKRKEFKINVSKGEMFFVNFLDARGRRIEFLSDKGEVLATIDIVKDLSDISSHSELLPNQEFYFDIQAAPKSKLLLSTFSLETAGDDTYRDLPNQKCVLSVGDREVVLSRDLLNSKKLIAWPDGIMGVIRTGDEYTYFGGNPVHPSKVVGSLDNPVASSVIPETPIREIKGDFEYASGGPVYKDESGLLLMFYHTEKWKDGNSDMFYSSIAMAKSVDGGDSWVDLGEIIKTELQDYLFYPIDVSSGSFIIKDGYFYVYFHDALRLDEVRFDVRLAVARAKVEDVVNAANSGNIVAWKKYYQGKWEEPGIGGKSSPLEIGNPNTNVFDVSYNEYLGRFIMITTADLGNSMDLYYAESVDGIHWSARRPIDLSEGDKVYPTIIGLGDDPHITGSDFYVYYVQVPEWYSDERWTNSYLARREITCKTK